MTSRERVLAAVSHHEPDRVPLDLNGTIVNSLTRIASNNLRERLTLPPGKNPEIPYFAIDTVRASDGGFVFFPSRNIKADVSPDRIDAVFRAAVAFGVA
jgi:hypothetical protein